MAAFCLFPLCTHLMILVDLTTDQQEPSSIPSTSLVIPSTSLIIDLTNDEMYDIDTKYQTNAPRNNQDCIIIHETFKKSLKRRRQSERNENSLKRTTRNVLVTGSVAQIQAVPTLVDWNHIVYVDLDNWGGFFQKLSKPLPRGTLVKGFYQSQWTEKLGGKLYEQMKLQNAVELHPKCLSRKDAADFALVLTMGADDVKLDKSISFTIISGDGGFQQVVHSMGNSFRNVRILDPHKDKTFSKKLYHF